MLDLAQKAARAIAFEWRIGAGEGENRWSPDLEAMYGLEAGAYDGTYESWKKLVYAEDWPAVQEAIKAARDSGDVAAEYRVVHKGAAIRWLQAKGRMFFDSEGNPERVVGFMLDVTERRQAGDELQRMEGQLRQAQRLEAMGTLAGGIAHDFNNLLGAILGYGEMALRDAPTGSRLRRDLDSILIAGERGRALVDRILAFSRSGVGERVAVHVEAVVRETLDQVAANLPDGIAIEERLRAGSAAVMGDATQVHQVVMNLATNAVQAMPSGGTLRVSLGNVRVDAPRAATTGAIPPRDYVVLEVADTGSGIPPEILERIFDPFFTTKDIGVGSGLGLSLVHGIVSGLGGVIDVASTVGKGSVFTVYVPRAGDAVGVSEPGARAQSEARRGAREQVLIVDDEESLVRLATETLTELGYAPVGYTSSAAAFEAFSADPKRFDAMVTDASMPGMSGSELIRKVRKIRPAIPILLVSGYLSAAVVRRAREAGADEVLKKPLFARELASSLAGVLHAAAGRPRQDVGVSASTRPEGGRRRRSAATRSTARPARRR
jgi:PAS domain S-box-containing protein